MWQGGPPAHVGLCRLRSQVAIPGFVPPFVPSRYGQKYARGYFERAGAAMYVNRGLGPAVVAVRFMVRPEIAILTIRSA